MVKNENGFYGPKQKKTRIEIKEDRKYVELKGSIKNDNGLDKNVKMMTDW